MSSIEALEEIADRIFLARKRAYSIGDTYLCYLLDVATVYVSEQILEALKKQNAELMNAQTRRDPPEGDSDL